MRTTVVLLPGLDGTGDLFAPLLETAPAHLKPVVVKLPHLGPYADLLDAIRGDLPESGPFVVLGESFSGPSALEIARQFPECVTAVILCNSFVAPPLPPLLRFLPWSLLLRVRPPLWVIRSLFVGRSASPALVTAVRAAIVKTPPPVLAARMRAVFSLPEAAPVACPVLFLCGKGDRLVSANQRRLRKVIPDLTWEEIAAPHLLLQAAPEAAWEAISSFLASIFRVASRL